MDSGYLRGMALYIKAPMIIMRDLRMTQLAVRAVPRPHSLFRQDGTQRPIFVHSHGLSGYTRMYSTLLTTIAAQGAFIIGVNHTDQSAAYCTDEGRNVAVLLKEGGLPRTYRARKPQLDIRVAEIRNTVEAVINGTVLRQLGVPADEVERCLSSNPQAVLIGHSFGGATSLATAHEEEKKMRRGEPSLYRNIACVVCHDPWFIPLYGRFFKPPDLQELPDGEVQPRAYDEGQATYSILTLLHHSQDWFEKEMSWDFFAKVDARVHAQLAQEGLAPSRAARPHQGGDGAHGRGDDPVYG